MANLTIPIKVELKDEIGFIRYLLDEIEEERTYNEAYNAEEKRAIEQAEKEGGYPHKYMSNKFTHSPRQSVINDDLKMIRRLCLKIREA